MMREAERANQPDAVEPEVPTQRWVFIFGLYLIILSPVLFYVLFRFWPGQVPMKGDPLRARLIPGLWEPLIWPEVRLLILVAVAGALGSYIHLATSFANYLGNREFVSSWKWWYILRPFIASALAEIVYFAVRGGLVSGGAGAGDLSPYGVAGLAGLTGMFSKQATDKLREVFENLFKTQPPPRADPLGAPPAGPAKPNS